MDDTFDSNRYYSKLKTRHLGRPCIYFDKVETTIDASANLQPGTLVVAREQTKGKGQRSNTWNSPKGCAMASLKLACGKKTFLASRLCFLQHIVALVAARTLANIDSKRLGPQAIKLKWPNDILHLNPATGETKKIGGILVHTIDKGEEFDITLSFGLNVFNKEPTTCLYEILNHSTGYTIDSIIADMMNQLEDHTDHLTPTSFLELKEEYGSRCLQINKLIEDERHGRVKVKDIDDDGFLVGERCEDSKTCVVTKIVA